MLGGGGGGGGGGGRGEGGSQGNYQGGGLCTLPLGQLPRIMCCESKHYTEYLLYSTNRSSFICFPNLDVMPEGGHA